MTIENGFGHQSNLLDTFVETVNALPMFELFPLRPPLMPVLLAPKTTDVLDDVANATNYSCEAIQPLIDQKKAFILENIRFKRMSFNNMTDDRVLFAPKEPFNLHAELNAWKTQQQMILNQQQQLLTPPVSQHKNPFVLKSTVKIRIPKINNETANFSKTLNEIIFDLDNGRQYFIIDNECCLLKLQHSKRLEYAYFCSKRSSMQEGEISNLHLLLEQALNFMAHFSESMITNEQNDCEIEYYSASLPLISMMIDIYADPNVHLNAKSEETLLSLLKVSKALIETVVQLPLKNNTTSLLFHWIRNMTKLVETCKCDDSILIGLFYSSLKVFEVSFNNESICVYKENIKLLSWICKRCSLITEQLAHEIVTNPKIIFNDTVLQLSSNFIHVPSHLIIIMTVLFEDHNDCTLFAEKLFSLLVSKSFDQNDKQSSVMFRGKLESFVDECILFVSDIVNYPGSEFALRILANVLIRLVLDPQTEYLLRAKCIDTIGNILVGLPLNADKSENGQLIQDFLSICKMEKLGSFQFNFNDFGRPLLQESTIAAESFDANRVALLKPLFQSVDYYLSVILRFIDDANLTLRSKALKIISTLVTKFPVLSTRNYIISAIETSINDISPSVREACLELISRFVALDHTFNLIFYQIALSKIFDNSIAVRRRGLKIIHDNAGCCFQDENMFEKTLSSLIQQINNERDSLTIKLIGEVTMTLLDISNTENQLMRIRIIQKALSKIITFTDVEEAVVVRLLCIETSLATFQKMIDFYMDESINRNLSVEELSVLAFISRHSQVQFDRYQAQVIGLIQRHSENRSETDELYYALNILSTMLDVITLRKPLQEDVVKYSILFLVKYPENIAVSAMNCLVNICAKSSNHDLLNDLLTKFTPHINSSVFLTKSRALINISNLLYLSFQKKIFNQLKVEEFFDLIHKSMPLDFMQPVNEQLNMVYFRSLERLILCVPSLGTRIDQLISFLLQPQRKPLEILSCLRMFLELLKHLDLSRQEKTMLSPTKPIANDVSCETGNVGYGTALIQSHLQPLLLATINASMEIQRTAILLLESMFTNGIVHPGELFTYVLGFCASTHPFVQGHATGLFEKMCERHKSLLLNCNPLNALLNISRIAPSTVNIYFLYSFFSQKKQKRNHFFKSCLSLFDLESGNYKKYCHNPIENSFIFFVTRILANLSFSKLDDLYFLLYNLNLTCAVLAEQVENASELKSANRKIVLIYAYLANELRSSLINSYGIDSSKIEAYMETSNENSKVYDKPCCKLKSHIQYSQKYPNITAAMNASLELLIEQVDSFLDDEHYVSNSKRRKE